MSKDAANEQAAAAVSDAARAATAALADGLLGAAAAAAAAAADAIETPDASQRAPKKAGMVGMMEDAVAGGSAKIGRAYAPMKPRPRTPPCATHTLTCERWHI